MTATPFDQTDHAAFAGAANFDDGLPPLVDASGAHLLYVGSATGIEVHESACDSDDPAVLAYHVEFPTQAGCKSFMAGLPGTIEELEAMGFKRIN